MDGTALGGMESDIGRVKQRQEFIQGKFASGAVLITPDPQNSSLVTGQGAHTREKLNAYLRSHTKRSGKAEM